MAIRKPKTINSEASSGGLETGKVDEARSPGLEREKHIGPDERERFREMAEGEILGVHEGNFARYQIRPSEFAWWQKNWNA